MKATNAGADSTILGFGLTEVTVAPAPDTTGGPVVRNVEHVDRVGRGLPSERELRSIG